MQSIRKRYVYPYAMISIYYILTHYVYIYLHYAIYILYNNALGIRHILSVLTRYVYTPTLCNLYNNALGIRHTPLGIDYSIHNTASGVRHAVHQNALYDRQWTDPAEADQNSAVAWYIVIKHGNDSITGCLWHQMWDGLKPRLLLFLAYIGHALPTF